MTRQAAGKAAEPPATSEAQARVATSKMANGPDRGVEALGGSTVL